MGERENERVMGKEGSGGERRERGMNRVYDDSKRAF